MASVRVSNPRLLVESSTTGSGTKSKSALRIPDNVDEATVREDAADTVGEEASLGVFSPTYNRPVLFAMDVSLDTRTMRRWQPQIDLDGPHDLE